jgi:chemotaxis protein histidine kinase CheA
MPPAKTSYSDLKVVDLKDLLKERGIMPKGNKADLVKLLEKADAKKKAKRDKKKAGGKVEKTNQKKTGGEGKKRRKEKEEVVEVEEEEEEEVEEEEEEVEVEVEVEKKKSRRRKKKPVEEEAKEVEDVEEDEEEVEDVEEDEEEVEDVEEAEEEEKTEQEDDAEEDEVEEAEEEGEPTPKRSFRKSKSPTEKEPTPAPSSNPSKKKIDVREAEVRSSRLEGLFGTMKEVSDKLCENRDLLEIFSLKTDEKFDALVESVFSAKTVDQMKKLVEEYASFGYDCKLKESHTGVYLDWLKDIAGKFQQILVIPKPESEPLFDSALGVYRIGDYAFTKDDGDETSSLVFGVISKNTVVPLTLKTIKECPAE